MDKEYAYIVTGAKDFRSSEASVTAWLEKELSASDLDADAKAMITGQSLVLVEFRVLENEEPALIIERELMPLWQILDNRFSWKADAGKGQSSSKLTVTVLHPKFYQHAARRLLPHRYFLNSLRAAGQVRDTPWVKCNLELPQRSLLKTEVVLFSVWGASLRVLAEIWLDVPLIALGPRDWPKAIANAWPGMRIGVRSGDRIRYSDSPGKNELWVKGFDESIIDADFSIYPRWKLSTLEPPDEALDADQVIEVSLRNIPGNATDEHYVLEIPHLRRETPADWHFYVGVYMSYRSPFIHYGELMEDGTIAPQAGKTNQWFVRCDASQLQIELHVSARELTRWRSALRVDAPAQKAPVAWRKWSNLMSSASKLELNKTYIQSLVERCLVKSGLPEATRNEFKNERSFRFKYLIGLPVYSPNVTAYVPPRYKYFSFEQVLLGEPQRRAYFQEVVSAVHVRGEALSSVQVEALTGLRDTLLADFVADIDALSNAPDYAKLFADTCQALARVRVGRYLAEGDGTDNDLCSCAFRYLRGELKPRLLLFNNEVVPNVIVLKFDSQKALLVSLNAAELKWVAWQPSSAKGQPSDLLMRFIVEHMANRQGSMLERADFLPQKKRYAYHYRRFPPEPISFRETRDVNDELRHAAFMEIRQQVNYAVFSSDEERRRAQLGMFKSATRAVAALVVAAVGPVSAVGGLLLSGAARFLANIADVGLNYALAQEADRPEDFAAYAHECKLGVLFAMVDLGADISNANAKLRVLLKQSTLAGKAIVPVLTAPRSYDVPIKLERVSESDAFLPVSFWLADLRRRLEQAYNADRKQAEYAGYLSASVSCGYAESKSCSDFLRSKYWETQAIGVLIFAEPSDPFPQSHFALSVRNQSDAAVVDFTLGHLDSTMVGRAFLGSVDEWVSCLRSLPALEGKLVIYKCYITFSQASVEVDTLFPLGVSWGSFFGRDGYSVIALPSRMINSLRDQIQRVWSAVFLQMQPVSVLSSNEPGGFDQADLLTQVSNLAGLVDVTEGLLRQTIGVPAIGELRATMLSFLRAWQQESLEGYQELMDGVLTEEAEMVAHTLAHLEALQEGVISPLASTNSAQEDCIDWVARRAGIEDDAWPPLMKAQLQHYLSGDQATAELCDMQVLTRLYETLARHQERKARHKVASKYERLTPSTARALFRVGLKLIRSMDTVRQPECFFSLIMACRPYEDSNELFARIVYSITALRRQRFAVLAPVQEHRLSGLALTEPALG
ncbi:hypothetical protein [Pseudomonas sp. B22129]|uniref:hypothetical protein n=1 Tax=Pseudomonas sp. B22129 TaxID=3235111 RepID=UPI003782F32E